MAPTSLFMRVPFRVIATAERRVTYIQGDVMQWLAQQTKEWRDTHEVGAATEIGEDVYRAFLLALNNTAPEDKR